MVLQLSHQEFLDHSTSSSGSGFLKNWKEDGHIKVWVHPNAPIYSLWGHSWFRFSEETDERTKEDYTKIRLQRNNCLESEKLLKKQKWRDRKTDAREMPPVICPHCLSVEWVREQINLGNLEWDAPVFQWALEGDTGEDITLYAGGYCGLFQKPKDKLTREELAAIRRTGIKQNEAYKQNGFARQQYVLGVCSEAEIDNGWVITYEGQTLGDKLKKATRDEVKRNGGDMEQGHYSFNPYPFEWSYDDNKEFSDKYDVVALSGQRNRPSDKVLELLDEEGPDFSKVIAEPTLGDLYDSMKETCMVKGMPIDSFFEKAFEEYGKRYYEEEGSGGDEEAESESETTYEVQGETDEVEAEAEAESDEVEKSWMSPFSEADEPAESEAEETVVEGELYDCDACGEATMVESDMKCPKCGAEYAEDDEGNTYLAFRKCGNEDCMELAVPVDADTGEGECPQCGAIHDENWEFTLPKPKAAKKKVGKKKVAKKAASKPAKKAPRKKAATKHSDARQSRRSKARAALSG